MSEIVFMAICISPVILSLAYNKLQQKLSLWNPLHQGPKDLKEKKNLANIDTLRKCIV